MKNTVHSVDCRIALVDVGIERDLEIDERQHRADHAAEQQEHAEIVPDVGVERRQRPIRAGPGRPSPSTWSRCAPAACSSRGSAFPASSTASRSARNRPGSAPCPRSRTGARRSRSGSTSMSAPVLPRRAGDVVSALRGIGDRRRRDEGDRQREEGRQRLQRVAEQAEERRRCRRPSRAASRRRRPG